MTIETVSTTKLKPHKLNNRIYINEVIDKDFIESVKRGIRQNIIVNQNYTILSEQVLRHHLSKLNIKYGSPDLIIFHKNDYMIAECKFQDAYDNFKNDANRYGHGLPPWQFERYCDILNKKNIDTVLFIFCRTFKKLYYQKISILQNLEDEFKVTTKTGSRIVFDINKFTISNHINEEMFDKLNKQIDKLKNYWEPILKASDDF